MNDREPDEQTIIRYILGTLPEAEAKRLEETAFRDDEAFELVLAVEDDLLHEYAQGGLSDDERRRFEERLLRSPEGRARLARARELLAALQGRRTTAWRAWLKLAAALLLASGAWLAYEARRPRHESVVVRSLPRLQPLEPSPGAVSSPAPGAGVVVALALAPGLLRGDSQPQRVVLPADAAVLRLSLRLPASVAAGPYRAALLSAEGEELWSRRGLTSEKGTIVFEIPAPRLPEDDYEIVLDGVDGREAASYAFGVLRE